MSKRKTTKSRRKASLNEEVLGLELSGVRAAVAVAAQALSMGSHRDMGTVLQRMALNPLDRILKEVKS